MDYLDEQELVIAVLGLPEDSTFDYIEEVMYNRFECSVEQFAKIAEALIPFTIAARSTMSDGLYQGFVKDSCFIVKQEVK